MESLIDWIVGTKFSVGVTNVPNLNMLGPSCGRTLRDSAHVSLPGVLCIARYNILALLLLSSDLCTA